MIGCLKDFTVIRPQYEQNQEQLLEWIVKAHAYHAPSQEEHLREKVFKLGMGGNKIQKRGFAINDCNHQNWSEMEIYKLDQMATGLPLDKRMEFYLNSSTQIFEDFYKESVLPNHLVHVSCTGYVAPSPAQRIVSKKQSGSTMVTHAYHMGCYGSIPAIRMGQGHLSLHKEPTDIVHTEYASLHMNPTLHTTEQLVIQSLFADGFIKYTVDSYSDSRSLKILAIQEKIIENSTNKMSWSCSPFGFQMSLSKDIPVLIQRSIESYLNELAKKGSRAISDVKKATFAIHPGGPKIIEQIANQLSLSAKQIAHSESVLRDYGNMSSATLPHVWKRILDDPEIQKGDLIVSLAFGPGLSICGGLFEVG